MMIMVFVLMICVRYLSIYLGTYRHTYIQKVYFDNIEVDVRVVVAINYLEAVKRLYSEHEQAVTCLQTTLISEKK